MVNALHLISVQRGYDPRDFVLVGFGGAGPVHANALARDAEMPTLLIPRSPGIFSATGLLTTDLKRDTAATIMRRLDDLDARRGGGDVRAARGDGPSRARAEGLGGEAIEFLRQIDLRYVGQSFELTIPAGDELLERFHAEHDRTYGFSAPAEPVEVGEPAADEHRPDRRSRRPAASSPGQAPEPKERRPVYFAEAGDYVDCPIYDRYALGAGASLAGPAVVEEFDSTTVVHPGFALRVDEVGNLDHREGERVTSVEPRRLRPKPRTSSPYGIVVSKDVMVPMRDGVRLAFDIYRPARDGDFVEGRFPTIMLHTPYDKTDKRYTEIADFFVPRGYNVVLVDLRDRYRSEASGVYYHAATPHTGRDGYDICEWIAAQPWSNGRIGTVGSSYGAITQVRTALERAAAPDRDLARRRADEQLPEPVPRGRRDAGAHVLGALHPRPGRPGHRATTRKAADVWNDLRDLRQLFRATPWQRGQTSLRHVPPLEDCAARLLHARRLRRVLEPDRARLHAVLGAARRHPRDVLDRLVRPVPGRRLRVLRGDGREEHGPAAARDRPLEPRRHARRLRRSATTSTSGRRASGVCSATSRSSSRSSPAGCPTTRPASPRARRRCASSSWAAAPAA